MRGAFATCSSLQNFANLIRIASASNICRWARHHKLDGCQSSNSTLGLRLTVSSLFLFFVSRHDKAVFF